MPLWRQPRMRGLGSGGLGVGGSDRLPLCEVVRVRIEPLKDGPSDRSTSSMRIRVGPGNVAVWVADWGPGGITRETRTSVLYLEI